VITVAADLLGILLALLPLAALIAIVCAIVCALQRNWPQLPSRLRIRRVPSQFPDGKPLSVPERERFAWITKGYKSTAREPGWKR
jgi:hypothetical protein